MKATNTNDNENHTSAIKLTDEQRNEMIKSMKIGYYRVFYKQGLITAEQLAELIKMQNTSANQSAA